VADRLNLSFPREPDSVPAARAALARFEGRLSASALYDASLCLSELVTNAVQHPAADAGEKLELHLALTDDALRVQVIDPGGDFAPGKPTEGDERGWGLFIVDQLSTRWGTEPEERRTVMWFEIDRAGEQHAEDAAAGGERASAEEDDPRRDEIANAVARRRFGPALA
jgi:anti-sigma regulatory factor (Ser/Thr protein kinase)